MTQDANTAALNKKERADAANDAIVDAYQERAIEELTDNIMQGGTVLGWTRVDFVDGLLNRGLVRPDDLTTLIFGSSDYIENVRDRVRKHIEDDVRLWLTDSVPGQYAVSDHCHELAADDAERHKEERGGE